MFYIQKSRLRRNKEFSLIHIGPAFIVFVAFFGVTILTTLNTNNTVKNNRNKIMLRDLEQTKTAARERVKNYEDILRASVGFYGGSEYVTRSEWANFIKVFDIDERYPGILGVGYVQVVNFNNLTPHIENIRNQGDLPDYTVYPAGDRPSYANVVYIEPMNINNQKVIGYDMFSEVTRKRAMDLARDSGQPTISDPVTLIQDSTNKEIKQGLLMYLPLYDSGIDLTDSTIRNNHLTGYIYIPFKAHDFFKNTIEANDKFYGFRVYDGNYSKAKSNNSLLYESPSYKRVDNLANKVVSSQTFRLNNQEWTVLGAIDPAIIPAQERNRPASVLLGGVILSVFAAGFLYLMLLNRTRVLAQREDLEITNAKDELLALASHQLRTPATGVKQYIGMLREGYAGKLNHEQQAFIDKAYASNERQLSTINEMLFVARSDAGNIELHKESFDLASLLRDVVEEVAPAVNKRRQKMAVEIKPKKILSFGDHRYLRMAIENIISNATKYTPEAGSIDISLTRNKHEIELTVADSGVGVSKDDYALLFQKFSRIPNELTNQVTGSGIGLYLARKVIDAHDGKLDFDSELGVGSTCTIILPLQHGK